MEKTEKKVSNGIDISKVGLQPSMAKLSVEVFKKWCNKHNFTGDLEGALKNLKAKSIKKK